MATSAELRSARSRRFILLGSIGSFCLTVVLLSFVASVFSLGLLWLVAIAVLFEGTIYFLFLLLFWGITNHCGLCTQCSFSRILHVPMGGLVTNNDCNRNTQSNALASDRFALIEVPISKYKLPGYVFKYRKRTIVKATLRIKAKVFTKDALYVLLGSIIIIICVTGVCLLINATLGLPNLDLVMSSTIREAPLVGAVLYGAAVVEKIPEDVTRVPFNLEHITDVEYNNRLLFVEAYSDISITLNGQYISKYRFWYASEPVERKFFHRRTVPCYIYTDSIGISRVLDAQHKGDAKNIKIFVDSVNLSDIQR